MSQPNILFLMTDQMQGRVLDADHPCITPNFDKLAARGVRITRAYTPNAVCSPARASLMTGRLPHSHGVLTVTHCVDPDQSVLRTGQAHWAQHLQRAGYRTGYFGKWHVHRGRDLTPFGWDVDCHEASDAYRARRQQVHDARGRDWQWPVRCEIGGDRGYRSSMLYGAVDAPPEQRMVGITSALASALHGCV